MNKSQIMIAKRVLWSVVLVSSVSLSAWAMCRLWAKWQASPIIISVNEQLMAASEVPFPAVTVCPQAKMDQWTFNFTEHWITFKKFVFQLKKENQSDVDADRGKFVEYMKNYIEQTPFMAELIDVKVICRLTKLNDYDMSPYVKGSTLVQNIIKVAPKLKDVMVSGFWPSKEIYNKQKDLLSPVVTKEGLCFTFNSLPVDEIFHMDRIQRNFSYSNTTSPVRNWTMERGYSSNDIEVYPWRGQASGFSADFKLFLKDVRHRDLLCNEVDQGFKVYIHHPADFSQKSINYYSAQVDQIVSFAIKPNVITSPDALLNYPPQVRKCYFPSERKLWFFKTYTQSNCRLECLANRTLGRCGCVAFYMPCNGSTTFCTSRDEHSCLYYVHEDFSDVHKDPNNYICECLPLCYSVQYEAEVVKTNCDFASMGDVADRAWMKIHNITDSHELNPWPTGTSIEMYMKEAWFPTLRRSESFKMTEFLAYCGLLGLFLGFSFLSLVELFYSSHRLGCMYKKENKLEMI